MSHRGVPSSPSFIRVNTKFILTVLAFFCFEELKRNRENTGKHFGPLFRQKAIDEMQRKGIPLGYFFSLDRKLCRYSPDVEIEYKFFLDHGFVGNEAARKQALDFLNRYLPKHIIRKAQRLAWRLRNMDVSQAVRISDKADLETIARSKLLVYDPEILTFLDVSGETIESDVKRLLLESCKRGKPLPTANPESIRRGAIKGLVKTSGFFMVAEDCLNWADSENNELIALFSDSIRNPTNVCIAVVKCPITIEQLNRFDRSFPRYIVVGVAEPMPDHLKAQGIKSNGILRTLAVLENVLDSTVVILSTEECAKEIQDLASADRGNVYRLLQELVSSSGKRIIKEDAERILRFVKDEIVDETLEQFGPIKYPRETLRDRTGTCKDKVCLAYSLLGQLGDNIEKIGVAFFDTVGNNEADHVAIEFKLHAQPSEVFELTRHTHMTKKHIQTITLPAFGKPDFVRGARLSFDFVDEGGFISMPQENVHPLSQLGLKRLPFYVKGFVLFNLFEEEVID